MEEVFALIIVKNEAHRFLDSILAWHSTFIENVFIVDDGSTDETARICNKYAEWVVRRPDDVPSFLEDEAAFRGWAWKAVGDCLELKEDDWLLLLDADEYYMPQWGVQQIGDDARSIGADAIRFKMPEVWFADSMENGRHLYVRKDGFWNKNRNIRMVRYHRNATFKTGVMGGGSVPSDYNGCKILDTNDVILHFGYLFPEDRLEKYERYKLIANSHSQAHIDSILRMAELELWEGPEPIWWRGLSESL